MRQFFTFGLLASLGVSLLPPAPVTAATIPDFVVYAVAQVTTYVDEPFDENTSIKQGSGVFVDHSGCLFTNSHVVLDAETGELDPHVGVSITRNRAKAPEFAFEGEVIFVDQAVDLAYVCPKEETGVFTEYFDRYTEPQFASRSFGEDVWVMGYPAAGEGTVTVSQGQIVGFIDTPDVSQWSGLVALDTSKLKLYKVDALAGPGISGGIMINSQYQLMGVPFAGTIIPGAYSFVLSEDVYLEFERRLQRYMYRNGLVPLDCVYDKASGYYQQAGQRFYDNQCRWGYDADMEHEVKTTYKSFCSVDISQTRLANAIRRSKELGDLSKWSDSVAARCGGASLPSQARKESVAERKARLQLRFSNMSKRVE